LNRRLLFVGSATLVLSVILFVDRGWPPLAEKPGSSSSAPGEPYPPTNSAGGKPALLNPLEGLVDENFTAMLERPLFNPGRAGRPPEPPPEPPPPPVEELLPGPPPEPAGPVAEDYVLVAVAAGPAGRVAAVRLAATGEVLYLREGQPIQDWNVVAVDERSVVIGSPENNVEIVLFDSGEDGIEEPAHEAVPQDPGMETPPEMGMEQVPPEATEPLEPM
jgi:hypothetical protein